MIYGLNFNRTEIPPAIARKFPKRARIWQCTHCHDRTLDTARVATRQCESGKGGCEWIRYRPKGETGMAQLQGVATDKYDVTSMLLQANNGHRLVLMLARKTAGGLFYGIYCY